MTARQEKATHLGAVLKRLRLARGWKQEAAWLTVGISESQWKRLEGGKCLPSPLTWEALKHTFPELRH